jgi:hypothetical protein
MFLSFFGISILAFESRPETRDRGGFGWCSLKRLPHASYRHRSLEDFFLLLPLSRMAGA